MTSSAASSWHKRNAYYVLVFEFAFWHIGAIAFLFYYTSTHAAPTSSITANLSLVAIWFMTVAGLRLLCFSLPIGKTAAHLVSTTLIVTSLASLWAYYLVSAIGLVYWGRVPSYELLQGYSGDQLRGLLQALEVPAWQAASVIFLGLVALSLLVWHWLNRFDWAGQRPPGITPFTWGIIGSALVIIALAKVSDFIGDPPISQAEPFALTFFPGRESHTLQGMAINRNVSNNYDNLAQQERQEYAKFTPKGKRNFILFVVDGLRPDRMGIFGAKRNTTPFLSSLESAGQIGVRGELHAVCAESTCGLLALNSSRFPHQFSAKPFTFLEALRMHGYDIFMLLSGDHTSFYGLRDYYGETDFFRDGNDAVNRYINDDRQLLDFVNELPPWSGKPVMIQFHLMSAHNLGARWLGEAPFQPSSAYTLRGLASKQDARNHYDNGVFQTDRIIELLIDKLEDKGYLQSAAIGITADHGEALGEHGFWSHANTLRQPAIKIPLILIPDLGRQADSQRDNVVGSQVDIVPTVMDLLNLPIPKIWSGASLLSPSAPRMIHMRQRSEVGLVDFQDGNTWKYWIDTIAGEEHVYNLTSDPSEGENLRSQISSEMLAKWRLATLPAIGAVDSSRINE